MITIVYIIKIIILLVSFVAKAPFIETIVNSTPYYCAEKNMRFLPSIVAIKLGIIQYFEKEQIVVWELFGRVCMIQTNWPNLALWTWLFWIVPIGIGMILMSKENTKTNMPILKNPRDIIEKTTKKQDESNKLLNNKNQELNNSELKKEENKKTKKKVHWKEGVIFHEQKGIAHRVKRSQPIDYSNPATVTWDEITA